MKNAAMKKTLKNVSILPVKRSIIDEFKVNFNNLQTNGSSEIIQLHLKFFIKTHKIDEIISGKEFFNRNIKFKYFDLGNNQNNR